MHTPKPYSVYQYTVTTPPKPEWPYEITQIETRYCDDRDCERRHDDPSAKWDSCTSRGVCDAPDLEFALLIAHALTHWHNTTPAPAGRDQRAEQPLSRQASAWCRAAETPTHSTQKE